MITCSLSPAFRSLYALLLLVGGTTSLAAQADDFFIPPVSLPAGNPGDIIRQQSARAGPPSSRQLADAWQVLYQSSNALGEAVAVSGAILVPRQGDRSRMPIIGFAPGTQGPAFRCAPSRMINKGAYYEQPAINDMLERGYAVAITDYEGYQPQPQTTYIIGRAMGAALLDVVRAAQRLPAAGLSASAPVILRGYSQGGGASLWAGEMHSGYAPELAVRGIAAGGVPANLAQVALPLDGADGFGVLFYALLGQDNAYPELSLEPFLNDAGRELATALHQDKCILELLQDLSGLTLAEVTDINPLNLARFQRIAENELGTGQLQVPVFQYHEEQDGLVAFDQAAALRVRYCSAGVPVQWQSMDTGGTSGVIRHINLVFRGNTAVNQFIEQRLSGTPPVNNCP